MLIPPILLKKCIVFLKIQEKYVFSEILVVAATPGNGQRWAKLPMTIAHTSFAQMKIRTMKILAKLFDKCFRVSRLRHLKLSWIVAKQYTKQLAWLIMAMLLLLLA